MGMNICRATLSDAPILVCLAHEAYRHYSARIGRPPAPMLADFTRHITDDAVFTVSYTHLTLPTILRV